MIALIGATGQVGRALRHSLAGLGPLTLYSRSGAGGEVLDVGDLDALRLTLLAARPALIVNASAYTAVDQAESEPEQAEQINTRAPAVMAEVAGQLGVPLVHYSTDYVYPGQGEQAFTEDAPTGPLNVYGKTKLAGDEAIAQSGCDYLIFRTSWVYDAQGKNFLLTMRRLMQERDRLNIVADQIGAPTSARLIAEVTARVLVRLQSGSGFRFGDMAGVYHLAAGDYGSWFDFAAEIKRLGGFATELNPIPSSDYPVPATRPHNSRLDCTKLETAFDLGLPGWQQELHRVWEELSADQGR